MNTAEKILSTYSSIQDTRIAKTVAEKEAILKSEWAKTCATGGILYTFADGSAIRIDEDIIYIM